MTQDELVNFFVNDARLALNSGTMFGSQGAGFMRLNIAQPRAGLLNSLTSVVKALAARSVNA